MSQEFEAFAQMREAEEPAEPTPDEEEATQRMVDARVIETAAAHDGLRPLEQSIRPYQVRRQARLPAQGFAGDAPAPPGVSHDTETELAALIGECRYFMREIAFHSARLVPSAEDRIKFIDAACHLARTGADVGKAAAKLRAQNPQEPMREERRRMVFEHIHVARGTTTAADDSAAGEGERE